MTALTALAAALPRLPGKVPADIALVGVMRGAGIVVGQWGDGFMLIRVFPEGDDHPDIPLSPLLTREEIAILAEGALTDPRVKTWPLITNCLALGVMLADIPPGPEADAEPVEPAGQAMEAAA